MPRTRVRKPTARGAEYNASLQASSRSGHSTVTKTNDGRDNSVKSTETDSSAGNTTKTTTTTNKRITLRIGRDQSGRRRFLPPRSAAVPKTRSRSRSASSSPSSTAPTKMAHRATHRAPSPDVVVPKHLTEHHRRMGIAGIVTKNIKKGTVRLGTCPQPWVSFVRDGNNCLKGDELKDEKAAWAEIGIDFPFTK